MPEVRALNYSRRLSDEEIEKKVKELEKLGYEIVDVYVGDNSVVIVYQTIL
jgi:ribulose bisphosphate carboxylase small subunit